jgi:hypothetical protein
MGPAQNEELLRYYNDPHAWLLDADALPPKLDSYPQSRDEQSSAAREERSGYSRQ